MIVVATSLEQMYSYELGHWVDELTRITQGLQLRARLEVLDDGGG